MTVEQTLDESHVSALSEQYLSGCAPDSLYPMVRKEEAALFKRIADGDEEALDEAIERHTGLVAYFVHDFHGANGRTPELMQAGLRVLARSITEFGTTNGTRFTDYLCERLEDLRAEPPGQPKEMPFCDSHLFSRQPFKTDIFEWLESRPDF